MTSLRCGTEKGPGQAGAQGLEFNLLLSSHWFAVLGPDRAQQTQELLLWHRTKGDGLAKDAQGREMEAA